MRKNYGVLHKSARDRLLDLLSDFEWHTYKECHLVGGVRYGARILELKRLGYKVESTEDPSAKDGNLYRLVSLEKGPPQEKQVKLFLTEKESRELLASSLSSSIITKTGNALTSFIVNKHKL